MKHKNKIRKRNARIADYEKMITGKKTDYAGFKKPGSIK